MTEQDLIDLRNSLVNFNTVLDGLDTRVTVLEDAAVPKGTYFEQILTSFEGSPECCTCTSTPTCNCVGATSDIYLQGDADGLTTKEMVVEINGVVYSPTTGEYPSAYVPTDIATFSTGTLYMYNSADEYIQQAYYIRIVNLTANALCVRLTTVQDINNNDAASIIALDLPALDENSLVLRARTAYDLNTGADFTYTVNPTLEQDIGNSIVSNTATFCLSAV